MRFALLALGLAACASDPLTEVVVTIEPSPAVRAASESVSVRIYRPGDVQAVFSNSNAPWHQDKYTLVLAPESERAATQFRLEAEVKSGSLFAEARLIAGYVRGETRYVRMRLENGCSAACDPNSTCYDGQCVDARVDANAFATERTAAPESGRLGGLVPDGVVVPDAGEPASTARDGGELGSPLGSSAAAAPATPDAGASVTPAPADAGFTAQAAPDAGTTPMVTAPVEMPAPPPVPTTCSLPSAAACSESASCSAGSAAACLRLALMYDASTTSAGLPKSDAQAAVLYQRACTGGEMMACSNLGLLYGKGLGVGMDEPRAVALFTQACDGNFVVACDHLGWMLRAALGVALDEPRAIALFTRACNANVASGCNNLGVMILQGRGTPADPPRALPLLTRACDGGEWIACRTAAEVYERGAPGVTINRALARALYTRACTGGFADACAAADRLR